MPRSAPSLVALLVAITVMAAVPLPVARSPGMGISAEEATRVRGVRHVLWGHPEIPVDGQHMGSRDAPVAVVMWGDYTCPGCARFAQETLPTLVTEYVAPGRVQFEFRDYPFRGPASVRAAEAAACAADQDRFWDMHLTLFANQNGRADQAFSHEQLRSLAAAIGLDLAQYERCMASGLPATRVEASTVQAQSLGLDSVPALFVDGQPAAWHDWALLKATIEQVLVAPPTAVHDRRLTTPTDACISTVPASSATPQPGALVGLELVLALQPAPEQRLDTPTLVGIRAVLQRRLALLGLSGDVLRRRDGRILVRVDATDDPEQVTHALAESMLLEIIDPQGRYLPPGTMVETTLGAPGGTAPAPASTPVAASGGGGPIYETIISGADFSDVYVMEGNAPGVKVVGFELQGSATYTFYQYTSSHVGQPMSIVIDKRVISSPTINGAISTQGIIEGVSPTEVDDLVVQLKAGALAVPLALVECRIVSAAESALTGDPEAVTADALAGYRLRA